MALHVTSSHNKRNLDLITAESPFDPASLSNRGLISHHDWRAPQMLLSTSHVMENSNNAGLLQANRMVNPFWRAESGHFWTAQTIQLFSVLS